MKCDVLIGLIKRCSWSLLTFGVLPAQTLSVFGVIIPADRLPTTNAIPWQGIAGVPGGIPYRTSMFVNLLTTTNTNYKCAGDGVTDDSSKIVNAINACPSNQYVYAPTANYYIGNGVSVSSGHSYWTLRGDGYGKTVFITSASAGNAFVIGPGNYQPTGTAITGGGVKGSTSITVSSTSGFAVNQTMWIDQLNDGTTVFPFGSSYPAFNNEDRLGNNTRNMGTRALVTNITGNTLSFTPPLPFNLNTSLQPQAAPCGTTTLFSGFEDFTINGPPPDGGIAVNFYDGVYACWCRNIEFTNWYFHAINPSLGSMCCEFRHCYIHSSSAYTRAAGYSIQLDAANNCLIEDNIFYHDELGVLLQGPCTANVIAYNCLFDITNGYGGAAIMSKYLYGNHEPYPTMNLFEGNYASGLQSDFYYGPSGEGAALRNYLTGNDPLILNSRVVVSIDSHNWSNSVVGNILGCICTNAPLYCALPNVTSIWANTTAQTWTYDSGTNNFPASQNTIYRLGYPGSGNNSSTGADASGTTNNVNNIDLLVKSNTIVHGNWDYANQAIVWSSSISDTNIPSSYYLASKPGYFGQLSWPPYDPNNAAAASITNIPAGYRLVFGTDPPTLQGPTNMAILFAPFFSSDLSQGPAPLKVTFTYTTPFGTNCLLDFGDGMNTNNVNVSHVYTYASNYAATVREITLYGTNVSVIQITVTNSSP